jgi:hypothetical protein
VPLDTLICVWSSIALSADPVRGSVLPAMSYSISAPVALSSAGYKDSVRFWPSAHGLGDRQDVFSCSHSSFVIVCDGVSTEPPGAGLGGQLAASMLKDQLEIILESRYRSDRKNDYVNAIKKVMRITNHTSNHSDWLQSLIMYALYQTLWLGRIMMAVVSTAGRNLIVYNVGSVRVELWRWNPQLGRSQDATMQTQTTTQTDFMVSSSRSHTACLSKFASTPWTIANCQNDWRYLSERFVARSLTLS